MQGSCIQARLPGRSTPHRSARHLRPDRSQPHRAGRSGLADVRRHLGNPLGTVPIDTALARSILSRSPRIQEDSLAHLHEHSLEVQLPFIQYLKKDFTIVPIQMLDTRLETCLERRQGGGRRQLAEQEVHAQEPLSSDRRKFRYEPLRAGGRCKEKGLQGDRSIS